jgi:uncharacterized protein
MMNDSLCRIIAGELQARAEQVEAAVRLLDEGNTVPFIARYRKEVTGGLDDTQLRNLETRLGYLRELEDRRQAILKSIGEQGKLTDALEKAINGTLSKTELEDLYLPYKPKRRTRGQIAIEAGLEPLADLLWNEPSHDPETEAAKYIDADKGVADTKAALDGARYILMERFAEDARCWRKCVIICGKTPTWSPPSSAVKKRKARNSATTSITMNRSPPCRRTARWRCSAAATKACCSSL